MNSLTFFIINAGLAEVSLGVLALEDISSLFSLQNKQYTVNLCGNG
jgi:hypothetical protein